MLHDRTASYNWIAIAPDGGRIAWVQSGALRIARPSGESFEIPLAGPIAWSPDSRQIAILANGVWVVDADSRNSRCIANLDAFAQSPRWSPDGAQIAILYGGVGPALPFPAPTGVIGQAVPEQRIALVPASGGGIHTVSPPGRHVCDYDWSPDSRCIVAAVAPGPRDWWRAVLCVLNPAGGVEHPIYTPERQIGCPRWSPEGKRIAFLEGLIGDQTLPAGDLFTVASTGGDPINHTAGRNASASSIVWTSADTLLFTEYSGGGTQICALDVRTGSIDVRWRGDEEARAAGRMANLSLAADGHTAAIVRSSYDTPEEIWLGPIGPWRRITHENDGIPVPWGKAQNIEFESEGRRIQAWLIPPVNPGPGQRPLVVEAHGGPSGIAVPTWRGGDPISLLAASGYYVLMPNPRGSYGQGTDFQRANACDFGYGDLRDILAAVDAAIGEFPIDPDRIGITGWSYGGFLTMFAVTQTMRFKAAIAGAGIANWTSYYGQTLVDHWMVPYFGATPYDDAAAYEKCSPVRFASQVKTPTLIFAGEQDAECPPEQSYEFWQALQTLGVPTELVVYPGEGHALTDPAHRRDEAARTLAWFDRYLRL